LKTELNNQLIERLQFLLPGKYSISKSINSLQLIIKYSNGKNTVIVELPYIMLNTLDIQDTSAIVIEEIKKTIVDPNFTMNKLMGRK